MARLIETAEQHVALQLGNLTAQNIALSCALEQRDRALGDAQARIAELEAELGKPQTSGEAGSPAPDRAEGGIA